MPQIINDPYPVRNSGEKPLYTMDFALNLQSGETILTAVWTCALESGTDPNAAGRVSGAASINQSIVGSLIDYSTNPTTVACTYLLECTVTTSLGQIIIGSGHAPTIPVT